MSEFESFGKIARFNREICVTEKIDGTNAQVCIVPLDGYKDANALINVGDCAIYAGSRTRWITPEDDNFGFAKWVKENAEELYKLGPGRHFGEWWGAGIQRRYELSEKRFSLFNVSVWTETTKPECCSVVPVLWQGLMEDFNLPNTLGKLEACGSVAAPGFMKPEGLVVYHTASKSYYKKTLEKDSEWKGKGTP